jgi:ribosome-binding factor A
MEPIDIPVAADRRWTATGEMEDVSRRTERIASVIRDVVAEAIQARLSDPRLAPLTSITRVEVTPDLSLAHVNVSVMSDNPARRRLSVEALRASAGRMRTLLAERLATRLVPRLEFHLDDALRRGIQTVDVIDRLMAEAGARELPGGAEPDRGAAEPPGPAPQEPDDQPREDAHE